jgi:four helix bundle protein
VGDSGRDIQERAFKFACNVIEFCDTADDRRRTTEHLLLQLFAAGTSVGANLAEASAGQTKPDFIAKTCVSLKEAREARYWLLLIAATRRRLEPGAQPLVDEARQLVRILTAIVKNARSNPDRG